jgi:acyl transferase domain-containing protein/NADPH:quinone reductase-like Zn-dependent oxidoreductase/acyl carrier protein/short-subunit dehydrogenase
VLKAIEPNEIAIIGYGCRLPGAADPDAFWKVLEDGRSTVTQVQPDRWPEARWRGVGAGKSYVFAAGQLDAPWDFDPGFFGISPREAAQIDPQQRLMLQVTWEALEHARRPPSSLRKDRTGVFVGASSSDHANRFYLDPAAIDAGFMTGNTLSLISNRVSYALDLHGPSWTVDTACSSGLYALRAAAAELATGRIDTALVGAVNMLLSPWPFVGFSAASMLSKKGRCAAFDASGDGYVRSEGAVVFVLRSLDAAIADGDTILGVISGIGVNSDGRTAGVSMPSADRQAALLRDVYARVGISPDRLAFVEAHGTGTRAGDPQETGALGAVLGQARSAPLPIGSAKTNIGHLEAGAGLVGLLKAQMALEKGVLPRSLHFDTPNPDIDFEGLNLRVATTPTLIPPSARPWYAGVNAFGFGGANAHAVLRQPSPEERLGRRPCPAPAPLILSARSEDSLRALAARMKTRLTGADAAEGAAIANVCAYGRERMTHRLVTAADDPAGQAAALGDWLAGRPAALAEGRAAAQGGKTLFLYSGNGAQYPGMGRAAHKGDAAFRETFDQVSALFADLAAEDLTEALFAPDLEGRLGATSLAQPLLFAIQVATTGSLAARGVTPDATIGHSVGEVAAAWAAGAFDLKSAVRLIHARSSAQEMLRGMGTMAAALAAPDAVRAALAEAGIEGVSIAAENSARSVTISGPVAAIDAFAKAARKKRIAVKRLGLDYPFHSAAADGLESVLAESLAFLRPEETAIPFLSSTFGREADGQELGPRYWWANIRRPVLFRQGMEAALDLGCIAAVEVGPRPVLSGYARDVATARSAQLSVVPTMEDTETGGDISCAAARALAIGARVVPARFFGPDLRVAVDLPRYPWRNRPYQAEPTPEALASFDASPTNPLLGWRDRPDARDWHGSMSAQAPAWLSDHRVGGAAVLPAAAFVDMVLSAALADLGDHGARAAFGPGLPGVELLDLDIARPLTFTDDEAQEIRVRLSGVRMVIDIESRRRLSADPFMLHARARARALISGAPAQRPAPDAVAAMGGDALYALAARMGLEYGPAFRRALDVRRVGDAAYVTLCADHDGLVPQDHALHPALLDGAFHGLLALIADRAPDGPARAWLPVRIGALKLHRPGATPVGAWVELERASTRGARARIAMVDANGETIAALEDVRFRAVSVHRAAGAEDLIYRHVLVPLSPAAPAAPAAALADLRAPVDGADLDAGALLLDAAARRAAWQAARDLAGECGSLEPEALIAAGKLAPSARPLWSRIVEALEHDGSADPVAGRLLDAAAPALPALTEALAAAAPTRGLEIMQAMALPHALGAALAEGLGDAPAPTAADLRAAERSPGADGRWRALGYALDACLVRLPDGARFEVLILGAPPAALLLRAMTRAARVMVSDPDPRRARALAGDAAAAIPGVRNVAFADLPGGAFDLILSADALHRVGENALPRLRALLRAGGALAAAEGGGGLLDDLTEGRIAGWWRDTVAPDFAIGLRRSGAAWASALGDAGFKGAADGALTGGESALILAAAPDRAARTVPEAEAQNATIHVIHGPGEDVLARALIAALAAKGRVVVAGGAEGGAEAVYLTGLSPHGDALACAMARVDGARTALMAAPRRLWLVMRGGVVAGSARALRPADAALWGFGRVAANEWPDMDVRALDLDAAIPDADLATRLAAAIVTPGEDRELVLTQTGVAAVRAERVSGLTARAAATDLAACGEDVTMRLEQTRPGAIDSLTWVPVARRAPQGNEVEIEVAAAGLNFRDVMWAQGLLPEEALEDGFAGPTLGMECAGRVLRAGPAAAYAPGDAVIAFAPACFAGHVTVNDRAVAPLPQGLGMAGGAATPVAFLTAWHGLIELARLRAGETVLIHGGAGGVGLAAMQVAASVGARVIATAGSPARRELLRNLGAEHAFDSRSLTFADQVMDAAGGVGVDVVLNSLSGEAMERSIDCLRPFGRFVELGKRDFFGGTEIGLRPFRRNLSYFGMDADQLLTARPDLAAAAFKAIGDGFARGDLIAPPHTVFAPEDAAEAFRLMQRSGHMGKILIRPPAAPAAVVPAMRVPTDGAVLVIGGLGGFGAATALRLAERGVPELWLTSRSGQAGPDAGAAIAKIKALGTRVHLRAVDVADDAAMTALIAEINAGPFKLRGAVHAAMVLNDGLIAGLTAARIEAVMRPKIAGAAVLDRLTRGADLAMFVVFSSATGMVGNPGQGAYVAANCWMEAMVAERRRAGLPGLAMAWGAISDAGFLARDAAARKLLSDRLGGASITARDALDCMEAAMAAPDGTASAVICGRIDWAAAGRELALTATPVFARIDMPETAARSGGAAELRAELAGLPAPEAVTRITALLAAEASRILRLAVEEVDPGQPLTDMGFDSLMAVDLRMAAEEALGVDIPLMSIAGGATLHDVAARAAMRIAAPAQPPGDTLGDAANMSAADRNLASSHGAGEAEMAMIGAAARRAELEGRALG